MARLKRNNRLEITLSDTEAEAVALKAVTTGIPAATLVRAAALGLEVKPRKTRIEAEAVAALNRVGVNLNQITKVLNADPRITPAAARQLMDTLQRIDSTTQRINEATA